MTDAECRYAQIEKDCLLFACEKFHEYIYGAKIAAETDHKALLGIIKKSEMTLRLQRMMLTIGRYNMDLQYTLTKPLILADALSGGKPPVIYCHKKQYKYFELLLCLYDLILLT